MNGSLVWAASAGLGEETVVSSLNFFEVVPDSPYVLFLGAARDPLILIPQAYDGNVARVSRLPRVP